MSDPLPDSSGRFHVVIVGAGPAGLFTALRAQLMPGIQVLIVDQGLDLGGRLDARQRRPQDNEIITSGFGGAGLFSDGKLCLSHRIGSTVSYRYPPGEVEARQRLIDEVIRSGEDAPLYGADRPLRHGWSPLRQRTGWSTCLRRPSRNGTGCPASRSAAVRGFDAGTADLIGPGVGAIPVRSPPDHQANPVQPGQVTVTGQSGHVDDTTDLVGAGATMQRQKHQDPQPLRRHLQPQPRPAIR
jgi:hypothetical protein